MSGTIKVDGVHRKLVGSWAKIDGVWKQIEIAYAKENGVWKQTWKDNFPKPSFLTYPTTISRNQTITITTEDITGADFIVQVRYNGGAWIADGIATTNSFTRNVSANTSYTTIQYRIAAVESVTHDKQSPWFEGPVRSLSAEKLAQPTGFIYTSGITRGTVVKVNFNGVAGTTYNIYAVYKTADGSISEKVVFSGAVTTTGATYKEHTVLTSTSWKKIQFKIIASKTGYVNSDVLAGPEVDLIMQTVGSISTITYPASYDNQTITISWGAATNAEKYQLEVFFTGDTWTRIYWGTNRTFTWKVDQKGPGVQFRVRGTKLDYIDGAWKMGPSYAMLQPPLKTTTWTATATKSWRPQFGGQYHPDNNYVYQGGWTEGGYWGDYTGMAFFDYNNIKNTLAGKTIEKVQIYFYRVNAGGYVAGQAIKLHTHNYASPPTASAGRPDVTFIQGPFSSFARGEGKWITVSNTVANKFKDGSAKGIALYNGSDGYLFMSTNVKIEISYR